jgi:hypothetical protein
MLNPLAYTGITNNATDNYSWLADNLPSNSDNMLKKSTIYKACCLKRTDGINNDVYLTEVKIPNNSNRNGYDAITVNIPKTECDKIININNAEQVCDSFFRAYCSNIKTFLTTENKLNLPLNADGSVNTNLEKQFASTLQYYIHDKHKECSCYPYRSQSFNFPGVCISKQICATTIKGVEVPSTFDGEAYDDTYVYRPGNDTECNNTDNKKLKEYGWSDSDIAAQTGPSIGDITTDSSGNSVQTLIDSSGNIILVTSDTTGNTIKVTDSAGTELIQDNKGNTFKKVDIDVSGNVITRSIDTNGNIKVDIVKRDTVSSTDLSSVSKTQSKKSSIITSSDESGGLSTGAIVGISIGAIIFLIIIGIIIWYFIKNNK